jgi:hypothetical protein
VGGYVGRKTRISVRLEQEIVKDWKEMKVTAFVFARTQPLFGRDFFTAI